MESTELMHYGVKGMRWGVRKKYYGAGTEGFVPKKPKGEQPDWQYKKSDRQKRWEDDHGFNPHRPNGTPRKKTSIETKIESKIKDKVSPDNKNKPKKIITKERAVKIAVKGAEVVSKLLLASAVDDIFYGGAGKEAIKQTGRAAVTAIIMARGGYDIKWFDKQGRRVG